MIRSLYNNIKELFSMIPKPIRFVIIILMGILLPLMIGLIVYRCNFFTKLPGEDNAWLAFWGSYVGAIVTLCIAYLTWDNSKTFEKLQKQYYELEINANLRLNKVSIIPKSVQKGLLDHYLISLTFENKAKCLIQDISIPSGSNEPKESSDSPDYKLGITLSRTEKNISIKIPINNNFKQEFLFHGDHLILQFYIELSDLPVKKAFAQFCFHYSQFSPEVSSMQIELPLHITREDAEKPVKKTFKTELLPTPTTEKRNKNFDISEERYFAYAYETYIKSYNLYSTTN